MPPPDDQSALLDIRHYCQEILQTLANLPELEGQLPKSVVDSAIERWLTVIGEAVKRLSWDRDRHPEVPWKGWAGLRDVLVHAYDEVDDDQLRRITGEDVHNLWTAVERFLLDFSES